MNIELGKMYRDTVTGLKGVAVSRHEYMNGCVRISLQSRELHDGKPVEQQSFDIEQLVETEEAGVKVNKRPTGGPGDVPRPRQIPQR